jgi:hypothetical protein
MDPFGAAFLVALGLGVAFLVLVVAYRLLYTRLAPNSRAKRYFQVAIVWSARGLRHLSNAYFVLALAIIALFGYLTIAYS